MPNTEIVILTEDQLKRLEDKVRRGSAAFIEVGQALAKIREGKGYKLRGFDTFESYCQKEFGFTDRQGRRLIQSAETSAEVKKLTGAVPANESVAREWAPLVAEPEKLKKVVDQIEKKGYSVVTATAEAVKEAVQKVAPKPAPAAVPGDGHKLEPVIAHVVAQSLMPANGGCPHCHEVPDRYDRDRADGVWICSSCGGIVALTVSVSPKVSLSRSAVKVCPTCKKPVGDEIYCNSCGGKL